MRGELRSGDLPWQLPVFRDVKIRKTTRSLRGSYSLTFKVLGLRGATGQFAAK
jgi:hypothetical protein